MTTILMRNDANWKDGKLPAQSTPEAAGFDLRARGNHLLQRGEFKLVKAGVSIAMPEGMCALVLPRSGLALKHGVTVLNSPGLIDSDYRGELGAILINHGEQAFSIADGDRIAQLVFTTPVVPKFLLVETLPLSYRGDGGFGHTGRE